MFLKYSNQLNAINSINRKHLDYNLIYKPSNSEIILVSSILLETLSTACLKKNPK